MFFVFQKRMSPKISRKIIDHGNTYKACNKNVDWMIMCIKNAVEFNQVKNWHFYEIKKRTKFTTNMYSDLRLEYRICHCNFENWFPVSMREAQSHL